MTKILVRVLDKDLDYKVVKELGPMSSAKADKVEGGLNINLNHKRYMVVQIDSERLDED